MIDLLMVYYTITRFIDMDVIATTSNISYPPDKDKLQKFSMPPVRIRRSYNEVVEAERERMRRRRQNLLTLQSLNQPPTNASDSSRYPS